MKQQETILIVDDYESITRRKISQEIEKNWKSSSEDNDKDLIRKCYKFQNFNANSLPL